MSIAEKLIQIAENTSKVYAAGEAKWAKKFYSGVVCGTDEGQISIPVPFEPDFFMIVPFEAYSVSENYTFTAAWRDFRSFSRIGGAAMRRDNTTGPVLTTFTNNENLEGYVSYSNNEVRFTPPESSQFDNVLWRKECNYMVIAMNYSDGKDDAELLREYVLNLPEEGGSVTLSQKRFNETGMTEAQWAELIAQQPNWTFAFV